MADKLVLYNVRIPAKVRTELDSRAAQLGVNTSTYARAVLCSAATMPVTVRTIEVKPNGVQKGSATPK